MSRTMKFLFAVFVTAAIGKKAQCTVLCFIDPCDLVTDCPLGQQCQPHYDSAGCPTCQTGECRPKVKNRRERKSRF